MATGQASAMPQMPFDPQQMQAMIGAMMGGMGNTGGMGGMGFGGPDESQMDPMQQQAMMGNFMAMMQYMQAMQQQRAGEGMNPFLGMPSMTGTPSMPPSPNKMPDPVIRVSVEGVKFQYQLTEDDLHKVFSRYGGVRKIQVEDAGGSATITFRDFSEANSAMQDLNGKVLNGLDGTLKISWYQQPGELSNSPANGNANGMGNDPFGGFPPFPSSPYTGWGFPQGGGGSPWNDQNENLPVPGSPEGRFPIEEGMNELESKGVRKYTCRFLIGIVNDKDFQVARRIIGAKGANMKRIVKNSEAKLRLRGQGSGYFEGAGQKESAEPLQLCVSCTSLETYRQSVAAVEDLLNQVYDEYRDFCRENGKHVPNLQINMTENQLVYSSRNPPQQDNMGYGMMDSPQKMMDPKRNRGAKVKKDGGKVPERGEPGPDAPSVEEIEKLIDERNEARRACNFGEADRIRALLHSRGIALMDEPGGRGQGIEVTTWRYWRD